MNAVLKRVLTGLTIAGAVGAAVLLAPLPVIRPIVAVLILLAVIEFALLMKKRVMHLNAAAILGFLAGCALIAGGLWSLVCISALSYGRMGNNALLFYVLAAIKLSDTGGFAFGLTSAKLMKGGNHKMCPTISPNKSWEGLFGSVLFSSVFSLAFMPVTHLGAGTSLLVGITAALVGTAGDLVESKFKRWVGVKDSSTMRITNGMGGILDMVDSLLIAPVVIYIILAGF